MRLGAKDRKVLGSVELAAEKPMRKIRTETGFRDHTIRYILNRLESRGAIRRRPFINVYPLGYVDYAIYFSLRAEKEVLRERLLEELIRSEHVSWIATLGGDYQYGMSVCARHHSEVVEFLNQLSTRYQGAFFDKALSLRLGLTLFPRKYIAAKSASLRPLSFGGIPQQTVIDEKDFLILSALEHEEYTSHRDLARKLNMPPTTLEHRIRRLESAGVIIGYLYRIDAAQLGMQHFRLLLFVRGVNIDLRKRIYDFCNKHPNITYHIECLGHWDHELGVEVEKAEDMMQITEALYGTFGADINTLRVLSVFGHRKITNFPFRKR